MTKITNIERLLDPDKIITAGKTGEEVLDRLEKEEKRRILEERRNPKELLVETVSESGRILKLDDVLAYNGAQKTQRGWINYWNRIEDDRWFPSMADFYAAFKHISEENPSYNPISLVEDEMCRLLTSTKVGFHNRRGNIIHNYGSKKRERQEISLNIPVYNNFDFDSFPQIFSKRDGPAFVQALFGTDDDPETIMQVFETISFMKRDKIRVWTPPVKDYIDSPSRKNIPERVGSFTFAKNRLYIDLVDSIKIKKYSYGIREVKP